MAAEIGRLVDAGIARVLDLLILRKSQDGTVKSFEIDDLPPLADLQLVASSRRGRHRQGCI